MADPETPTGATPDRRGRRRDRTRRRARRIAGGVCAVLLVAAFLLRSPGVVVFFIGTTAFSAVSGDWKADYEAKVDSMMKSLIGSGRTVYWLGAPTLKDEKMDAPVVEVNAAAQEVAKRHPKVHYVDVYKLFSDSDGTFSADLPDENGDVVTMRAGDGVHLTMAGADYLARQVFKLVDAQCAVTAQKVDGAAKQTIESEG